MRITLLTNTPHPEKAVAAGAKLCYSSSSAADIFDNLDDVQAAKFIKKLKKMGHETPFEQAVFTFGIDGISKSTSQHLTRHRLASFNQKSQRYVEEGDFGYYVPENIRDNVEAFKIYNEAMDVANSAYKSIVTTLKAAGIPEKSAFEDGRYVLPNACETSLIMTMNARELFHFFKLRCCNRALHETRAIADEMLRLCQEIAPTLFEGEGAPCINGACPEGSMTCGTPRK